MRARSCLAAVMTAAVVSWTTVQSGAATDSALVQVDARAASEHVERGAWDEYFPFRLGDAWTYEWEVGGRMLPASKGLRTRVFEGTEFLGAAVGYRLVSDDGTYHLYTLTDGTLRLHSSSEAGRLLFYDPAVVLAAPEWRSGEPHVTEHPESGRTWTATIAGFGTASVPFGVVDRAMTVKLDMKGPDFASTATHVFAPRIGLVQYDYQLRDAKSHAVEVEVHARLRFARLAEREVRTVADLASLPRASAAPPIVEDRSMREALRKAFERRYTWDEQFPGFAGEFELTEPGAERVKGRFVVERDLSVKVEGGAEAARAAIRNDISSFVTQRKPASFDLTYAETTFKATKGEAGTVFVADRDPLLTTYTVKDGEIVSVGRSLGRVSYTANERSRVRTEDGRSITVAYEVVYVSNETGQVLSSEETTDVYEKIGKYWVPTGRRVIKTSANQPPVTRELRLRAIKPGA